MVRCRKQHDRTDLGEVHTPLRSNLLREKTLDYQTTHTVPNQEQLIALRLAVEKLAEGDSAFVNPGNAF